MPHSGFWLHSMVKKLITITVIGMIAFAAITSVITPRVVLADNGGTSFKILSTAVTNIAASTTNSTGGTTFQFFRAERPMRMWLTANGSAGTTNGSLVVKVATSYNGSNWDLASTSNIKLTMSTLGTSTNTVSDWFEIAGAPYIRVGQIENTFLAGASNIVVTVAYPSPN